jgi:hypothetical protein
VLGARTVGEVLVGTFHARAGGDRPACEGADAGGSQDVPQWVGRMGLIEAACRQQGVLPGCMRRSRCRHYGENLAQKAVGRSDAGRARRVALAASTSALLRSGQPPRESISPRTISASPPRVAAIGFRVGLTKDRAPLDALIDRAVEPFSNGVSFPTMRRPTGRLRPLLERVRALTCGTPAEQANRPTSSRRFVPSLTTQMKLWWDLVDGGDGYGYPWGRSLGVVSYMDTLEIVGFLAQHPEFRPAPLADLVSQYARAWNYSAPRLQRTIDTCSRCSTSAAVISLHHDRPRVAADDRLPRQSADGECRVSRPCWSARS